MNGNGNVIRAVADDDDTTRPAAVGRLRDQVRAGRYRPPVDDVVERLVAFLGVAASAPEVRSDAA